LLDGMQAPTQHPDNIRAPFQHAALDALHHGIGEPPGGLLALLQEHRRLHTDVPDPQDTEADDEDDYNAREHLGLQVPPQPSQDLHGRLTLFCPLLSCPAAQAADTTGTPHRDHTPGARPLAVRPGGESCLLYYSTVPAA